MAPHTARDFSGGAKNIGALEKFNPESPLILTFVINAVAQSQTSEAKDLCRLV